MRILRDGQMVFYGKGIAVPLSSPTGCVPAYPTIDAASFYATDDTYSLNAYSENAPALYGAAEGYGVDAIYAAGVFGYVYGDGIGTAGAVGGGTIYSIGVYAEEVSTNGYALFAAGDADLTGNPYAFSDKTLKQNVKGYTKGLEVVMQLKPKSYEFKEEFYGYGFPRNESIGFIAQDVQQVLPTFVKNSYIPAPRGKKGESPVLGAMEDVLSLNYQGLIPVLTSAIQEQQYQIDDLKIAFSNLPNQPGGTSIQQFGTITLNAAGKAIVTLPATFVQQYQNFSYQLTSIGTAQQSYISRELTNNKFEITGRPNSKVSWVVYGS